MPRWQKPTVRLQQDTNGGVGLQVFFKAAQPFATDDLSRYEIHEFIGQVDVDIEINGKTYRPKLYCKFSCELTPAESKAAQYDAALQRAREHSPILQ